MGPGTFHEFRRRPTFLPFRVYLTDGKSYEVHQPELMLVFDTYLLVGIPVPEEPLPIAEYTVAIPYASMERVELLSRTEQAAS